MKQSEIFIGVRYGHTQYSGYTYLGCGKRNGTNKNHLVIIGTPKGSEFYIGAVVCSPKTKEEKRIFWNGFYKKNS
jgi:hypothetical protein